ncbi:MAG: thrombospondin type 3 repeat-containing protein, partial [Anaerolineales bacterium]|nr:thrombospondin type 3 repeat-containing protein [Anaerolineales bacterium]
ILGTLLLLLLLGVGLFFLLRKPAERTRPVVWFEDPSSGAEVLAGENLDIIAVARDEDRISRFELWLDGVLVEVFNSDLPEGTSPFPLVTRLRIEDPGSHTLIARAFDTSGERAHATVMLMANAGTDSDGDGVPDELDYCLEDGGSVAEDGCPVTVDGDSDGDMIPDVEDTCPDEAGVPSADGCPDADGDGITDSDDACPEEPGAPGAPGAESSDGCPAPGEGDRDGDGLPDAEDTCPDAAGTFDAGGCPDRDGDGVPDADDPCPDEAGIGGEGCPGAGDDGGGGDGGIPADTDSDGDGVSDRDDLCPDDAGPAENAGCPEGGSGDRDGDGVEDDVDLCPGEAGEPEHAGCPPPGDGEDSDGDGIPDEEEPDEGSGPVLPGDDPVDFYTPIEFEALTFSVDDIYSEIYCYAGLAGAEMERFGPFDPLGIYSWDIGEYLGRENSRHVSLPDDELLEVRAECYGNVVTMGPEGVSTRTDDLGTIFALHPIGDWDGHVIEVTSAAGETGLQFDASYRICTPSCDEAAFQTPFLRLLHGGGDHMLLWSWDGDRTQIDGFHVYLNGSRIFNVPSDSYSQSVSGFGPLCGALDRQEYYITAYSGDRESAPSNLAYWSTNACPRQVTVTFQGLSFFDMGGDESWAEGSVGPIFGGFHAIGTNSESMNFNLTDPGNWWGEHSSGFRVRNGRYYNVQELFDWAHTETAECIGGEGACPVYTAPASNTVTIELAPYTDLTFGGYVSDLDSGNPSDKLFEGERTLSYDEIRPGLFRVFDRYVELTVLIDVIVGPEVGPDPDLTITNVTQEEESGQLRIHIFNNASGMVGRNLPVRFENLDGTLIMNNTWEDLSIPSGGSRILMGSDVVLEPSDLRVILDPDNIIDEENEDNNIYETPVTMRVEFIRVRAPHCNDPNCSIFDCDSEHVFHVFAGYGPERNDVEWVGYNVRFPRERWLRACGSPCTSDPEEDWYMEGDDRYTFEFEMPADELLFIMVTGYEQDPGGVDDSLGHLLQSYSMEETWGHSSDTYSGESVGAICNDTNCSDCGDSGLTAWWRITRVR